MEANVITNEQKALYDLLPSVSLTTEEQAALANWKSKPPVYPELTPQEQADAILKARVQKGQTLYDFAYARSTSSRGAFPVLDAKSFLEFIEKRGTARAIDQHWASGVFLNDENNRNVMKLLSLYFTNDPRFNTQGDGSFSLNKGIYLCGPMGVGKSILMDLCDTNPYACYSRHDCQVIVGEYTEKKHGGQPVIDYYSQNSLIDRDDQVWTFGQPLTGRYFDDLGQEGMGNHFGNEKNVMAQIIENRYRNRQFHLTHFSSNLTLDQLKPVYGDRVVDRLREMCNVIQYPHTAKSRRK